MEAVTGAMSTLLPKLAQLIKEEYNLQKSVRGEIMFLKAELESMEGALLKVSMAPIDEPPDIQVKIWARQVRELSYDIEDRVDTFMVRVDAHPPGTQHSFRGFINRSLKLLTKAHIKHKIGMDIKDIKIRLKEVSERRDRYKVDKVAARSAGPTVGRLRSSALYKRASDLVGIEENAERLVGMIMEGGETSKRPLKIVSIVGFGGLGKTTLANVVYQQLKRQFDCGAFVSVSLNPVVEKIFKSLLRQLDEEAYKNINEATWGEDQLISELRNLLQRKKYIIVIDDIWERSVWENTIKRALINNELGSKIITTTRILDVAKQIGSVYELKPLSPVDSRKLFYLTIFGTEERCLPKELAKESLNILRKCGGVPLAIITVGSMLASKSERENTRAYWSKVYKSMGAGLQNSSEHINNMRNILSVSYHDLPPNLRTCLLYISLYPEDHVIYTNDVIWKWIGEGFVVKEQGKDMFEVGEDYVHELLNRSLIQPVHFTNGSTRNNCFQIHDMVLDLITFLSNEEHFLTKFGAQKPESLPNKIHRMSIQTSNKDDETKLGMEIISHVRSLTVFSEVFDLHPELSSFAVLRVLDLTRARMDNSHCMDICKLLHLRYLALSITEIPKEIDKLKFLQVLDIRGPVYVAAKLPSSIVRLQQLLCLMFNKLTKVPDWFGNLKSLQELIGDIYFKSPATLHVLGGLNLLRRVNLRFDKWDESYEQPFLSWLTSMPRLKYLTLTGTAIIDIGSRCDKLSPEPQQLHEMVTHCALCSVPRWMSTLCYLSVLHIQLLTLGEEGLHILGSIPLLYDLYITMEEPGQSGDKELLVIGNVYPFLSLTNFKIYNMEVMFTQGAMQKLSVLKLSVWETMDQFGNSGFGLENLSSLDTVFVDLIISHAKPKEVEAAEIAIQKAVSMNPNKPKLTNTMLCELKFGVDADSRAVSTVIDGLDGVKIMRFHRKKKKEGFVFVVGGRVDPANVMENLKNAGIPLELPSNRRVSSPTPSGSTQTETAIEPASK